MLEFLATFFIFGTFQFWVLCVTFLFALSLIVEHERSVIAFFSLTIFLGAFHLFGDLNLYSLITEHPGAFLGRMGIYIGVGVCWSIIKYFFRLRKFRSNYLDAKNEWLEDRQGRTEEDWFQAVSDRAVFIKELPTFSKSKRDIVFCAAYWPASIVGTLLCDFITDFYHMIVDMFGGVFKRIYMAVLGDILVDYQRMGQK